MGVPIADQSLSNGMTKTPQLAVLFVDFVVWQRHLVKSVCVTRWGARDGMLIE
jgi:hypothetical protein